MNRYEKLKNSSIQDIAKLIATEPWCNGLRCTDDKTGKYFSYEDRLCLCDVCAREWLEEEEGQ